MLFDNIYDLVKDLRAHIKENDSFVIPCDEPTRLRLGYICDKTCKQWQIKLQDLANDNSESGKFAKKSFSTFENKMKLVQFLNDKETAMTLEQFLEKEFSQDATEYNPMFPRDKDQMKS